MARTEAHQQHIAKQQSWNNCPECSADRERRFARVTEFHYDHVRVYMEWARPRLAAFKANPANMDARHWYRRFMEALDRRIDSHSRNGQLGRKYADGYLERMTMAGRGDEHYLRMFAQRGASCLDS